MANTKTNLKFYRAAYSETGPSSAKAGAVWFDTTNRLIKVKLTDGTWQAYSGLQNATWNESKKQLVLTKADGTTFSVDLSDVASASALSNLSTTVSGIGTRLGTAEGEIDTLQSEMDAVEKKAADNAAAITKLNGTDATAGSVAYAVKAEADRAKGVEGGLQTAINGLDERVDAIEGKVTGNVEGQIAAAIGALDATVGSATVATGKHVAVQVVETDGKITAVNVAENFKDITDAIAAEETRALGIEGGLRTDLNSHTGNTTVHITAKERTAWNDAKTAIDGFLAATTDTDGVIETIAEINKYVNDHTTAFTTLSGTVGDHGTALATLNGTGEGSVKKAASDAQAAAEATAAGALSAAKTELQGYADDAADAAKTAANSYTDGKVSAINTAANALTGRVKALEDVKDAYKAADTALESSLKTYADGKASAAQTAAEAKVTALANGAVATNATNIETLKGRVDNISDELVWAEF